MSENKKLKTITYYRAQFLRSHAKSLSYYLYAAHSVTPNVENRTFRIEDQEVKCCHLEDDGQGTHYLHITVTTPGEPASTVPKKGGVSQVDLKTCDAPSDSDFMDGDIMMMVLGNHVMFCSTGLKPNWATKYLRRIFRQTNQSGLAESVTITPVADVSRLALIKQKGVKSISLAAGAYPATLSLIDRSQTTIRRRLLSVVWDEILGLFAEDDDLKQINEQENLTAEVVLRFDRRKKGGELGQKRLEEFAGMVMDETGGFKIMTFGKEAITAENITLKKEIGAPKDGKPSTTEPCGKRCNNIWWN
jgi:hypothetical protein